MSGAVLSKYGLAAALSAVLLFAFILYGGGSAAAFLLCVGVVVFYIVLPGFYLLRLLNIKGLCLHTALPVAFLLGGICFLLSYLLQIFTAVPALLYAVCPLLSVLEISSVTYPAPMPRRADTRPLFLIASAVVAVFSLTALPAVTLPFYKEQPFAPINIYETATRFASLAHDMEFHDLLTYGRTLENVTPYDLLGGAVVALTGISSYNLTAFYLPVVLTVLLCVAVYSLCERLLQNGIQAAVAAALFFVCSPLLLRPYYDSYTFVLPELFLNTEHLFALCALCTVTVTTLIHIERRQLLPRNLAVNVVLFVVLCLSRPSVVPFFVFGLFVFAVVLLLTSRTNVILYIYVSLYTAIALLLCFESFTAVVASIEPTFLQLIPLTQELRQIYTESVPLYYALLPMFVILGLLLQMPSIFFPIFLSSARVLPEIRTSPKHHIYALFMFFVLLLPVLALDIDNRFFYLLLMLFGCVVTVQQLLQSGTALKVTVGLAAAVAVVNLCFPIAEGVGRQLYGFGYIDAAYEQPALSADTLNSFMFVRENTLPDSIIATNYLLDSQYHPAAVSAPALTDRRFYDVIAEPDSVGEIFDETPPPNLRDTLMRYDIDYLLLQKSTAPTHGFSALTNVYENGEFVLYSV